MQAKDDSNLVKKLIIASRGSQLAKWQAHYVKDKLNTIGVNCDILIVKTSGDKIQDRFLHEIGGKGLFIKEIEEALLAERADIAIHSFKDMPANIHPKFTLPAILPRHHSGDVMIFNKNSKFSSLETCQLMTPEILRSLGPISIATGSLRRASLLKSASQELNVVPIRGNVDTRLAKLATEGWDALILAAASLERLEIKGDFLSIVLEPKWFVPSPAQGALAIESRENFAYQNIIQELNCPQTAFLTQLERLVLMKLGGDCTLPIGVNARMNKGMLLLDAVVLDREGDSAKASLSWEFKSSLDPHELADQVIEELKSHQVNKILKSLSLKSI